MMHKIDGPRGAQQLDSARYKFGLRVPDGEAEVVGAPKHWACFGAYLTAGAGEAVVGFGLLERDGEKVVFVVILNRTASEILQRELVGIIAQVR